ncbi:hypothetical protein FACS189421_13190 [Bacteroidia bacterium]|nr:hypothetical protein FACS189421_13190 [Bacteroidia bacterium]
MKHFAVFFMLVFCLYNAAGAALLPPDTPTVSAARVAGQKNFNAAAAATSSAPLMQQTRVTQVLIMPDTGMAAGVPQISEPTTNTDASLIAQYNERIALRDQLRRQQNQIRIEKSRCDSERKNWKTATIIGAVGTVGTAIGAIVQYNKIQDKKDTIESLKSDIQNAKTGVDSN